MATDQPSETFDVDFANRLARETWTLYGIAITIFALRVYTKCRFSNWRKIMADDYLALVAVGLYTGLIVCLNLIATGGGSNLYEPGQFETFAPEEIRERIEGSKIVIVSEQCMLCVIYCLKTCIIIFHHRLTTGTGRRRAVRFLAIAVGVGFLSSEIAFFTACRPFSGYWALPPPSDECSTLFTYAVVVGCFNITTDIAMIVLAALLVAQLQVPLKQKMLVGIVFSMGIFVIVAALLTKIFNLTDPFSPSYMNWYTREASIAMYVTNLIPIWPLLRHLFPCLRPASRLAYSGTRPRNTAGASFGNQYGRRTGHTTVIDAKDKDGVARGKSLSKHVSENMELKSLKANGISVMTEVEVGVQHESDLTDDDRILPHEQV